MTKKPEVTGVKERDLFPCGLYGRDPTKSLLNSLMRRIPEKDRLEEIAGAIKENAGSLETVSLVDPLERTFGGDGVAFRRYLRGLHEELCKPEGRLAPELALAILGKILQGWGWMADYPNLSAPRADAGENFLYICGIYPGLSLEVRQKVAELLRAHLLSLAGNWDWDPKRLNPWIQRKETPGDIAAILALAQHQLPANPFLRGSGPARVYSAH